MSARPRRFSGGASGTQLSFTERVGLRSSPSNNVNSDAEANEPENFDGCSDEPPSGSNGFALARSAIGWAWKFAGRNIDRLIPRWQAARSD